MGGGLESTGSSLHGAWGQIKESYLKQGWEVLEICYQLEAGQLGLDTGKITEKRHNGYRDRTDTMKDRDSVSWILGSYAAGSFPQQWRVYLGFPECRGSLLGPPRDWENWTFSQIEDNEEELITVLLKYTGNQWIFVFAIKLSHLFAAHNFKTFLHSMILASGPKWLYVAANSLVSWWPWILLLTGVSPVLGIPKLASSYPEY